MNRIATVRGLDCSHHQPKLDYRLLAQSHRFALVRACYGDRPDRMCEEHVRGFRGVGVSVGVYGFWRACRDAVSQYHVLRDMADACRIGPGDIVTTCDIEDDPYAPEGQQDVCPEWSEPARAFVATVHGSLGGCMVYCSRRDWDRLGRPEWLLRYPQWTPHWDVSEPDTPGDLPCAIHQTGKLELPNAYGVVFAQDVARLPLPTIPGPAERARVMGWIAETVDQNRRDRQ